MGDRWPLEHVSASLYGWLHAWSGSRWCSGGVGLNCLSCSSGDVFLFFVAKIRMFPFDSSLFSHALAPENFGRMAEPARCAYDVGNSEAKTYSRKGRKKWGKGKRLIITMKKQENERATEDELRKIRRCPLEACPHRLHRLG